MDRRGKATAALLVAAGQLAACGSSLRYSPSTPLSSLQQATANSRDGPFLQKAKLRALLGCMVRQQTLASCSVATATTILNAILTQQGRPTVSQQEVVQTDPSGSWARATADADSTGVSLDRLALLWLQAAHAVRVRNPAVDVVQVHNAEPATQAAFVFALQKMQQPQDPSFIAVNFLQSVYLKDGDPVGHMSVVGAYDAERQRVLVLDVDCLPRSPYWVPLDVMLAGMRARVEETGEPRGYLVMRHG